MCSWLRLLYYTPDNNALCRRTLDLLIPVLKYFRRCLLSRQKQSFKLSNDIVHRITEHCKVTRIVNFTTLWRYLRITSIDFGTPSFPVGIFSSECPKSFPLANSFLWFLTICSASLCLLLLVPLPCDTRRKTFWSRIEEVTFLRVYFWDGDGRIVEAGPVFLNRI